MSSSIVHSNSLVGDVTVSYETPNGEQLKPTEAVVPKGSTPGTSYDTTTSNYKPERIEKDGKVYVLKGVKSGSDSEKGIVTDTAKKVTYVYELENTNSPEVKLGTVVVNYVDESGNPISGKTPEGQVISGLVIDTDLARVGDKYDTTDNKPTMIIAENGDVYVLVKTNGTENGLVKEGVTKVDYVYKKLSPITPTPEQPIVPVPTPGNPTVPTATPGQPVVPTTTPEKPVVSKGKLANTGIESTSSTVLGALSAMLGLGGLFSKNRKSDKE